MATGNIAMTLGALLTLDDHEFNDRMEAIPATAEQYLSQVAESASRNLSQIGEEAGMAQVALEQSIGDAAEEAADSFDKMRESIEESFAEIAELAERYLSFGALKDMAAGMIAEFMEADIGVQRLKATLDSLGVASNSALEQFSGLADEIEELTRYDADSVVAAMAQGLRLGLDPGAMEDAAKAAVGLAEKLDLDLGTAMALIARASNGNTAMLAKYGLELDETKSKAEQFQEVLKIGKDNFKLAENAANTAKGRLDQMNNALGNMRNEIGKILSGYLKPIVGAVKAVAVAFNGLSDTSKRLVVGLGAAAAGMVALRLAGGGIFRMGAQLVAMLTGTGAAAAGAGTAAGGAAAGFQAFWTAAAGPIGIVLAGIVAVKTALDAIEDEYDEAIAKAKDAQSIAQQMREKLKDENKERTDAIRRLEEISRISHLNNATQDEANRLIEKYGFNMKVVNGQLVNMGDGFDKLIKKQEELSRKKLALSYDKEIEAIKDKLKLEEEKITAFFSKTTFKQGVMALAGGAAQLGMLFTGDTKWLHNNIDMFTPQEMLDWRENYKESMARIEVLKKLKAETLDGTAEITADAAQETEAAMRPVLDSFKKQREQIRLAAMDAAQLRRELHFQAWELKKQGIMHEKLQDFTKEEIDSLTDEDLAKFTDKELGKLKEMLELRDKIAGIYGESQKFFDQQRQSLDAYTKDRQTEKARRLFDKRFDKRLGESDSEADDNALLAVARKRVETAKAMAERARAWYEKGLETAEMDDIVTEKEKGELDRRLQAMKNADALAEKEQERHERVLETIRRHADRRRQEQEKRSADALQRERRRQADALQRQADEIARKLKMLGADNINRDGFAFDGNGRFRGNVGAGALARLNRKRGSMAETRAKLDALDAGQRTYIDERGRERRAHFSLQDKRNMREVEALEARRRRLEEKAKDYTQSIENVKLAVDNLGKNCLFVKR